MQAEGSPGLREAAERWLAADPDPDTRAELQGLLHGDPSELAGRFSGRLTFGTAGIRGPMGAGPTRMNRVLVRIVARALAERVLAEVDDDPMVVVGFDARHRSEDFASDTARVLAGAGVRVVTLPEPSPTPVPAFAVKHLGAAAGVMVTASHNPRTDNGYKVYWRGGGQLAAPIDVEIAEIIDRTPPVQERDLAPLDDPLMAVAGDGLMEAYLDAAAGLLAAEGPRSVRVAYTPLHGVGAEAFVRGLQRAGFDRPAVVAEQAAPDPDFPTAAFPNPEETGVLDPLLALAERTGADVALAHDPDADRLAVAVPDGGRWRLLSGDETGCLLAQHLLSRRGGAESGRRALVINTVVSSRLLPRIAAAHGAEWVETLTGFKWIMHAAEQRSADLDLVLAYEDALGVAAGQAVSDKDGITAGLVMAELVADLKSRGRTLMDLLDELHSRHGVHVTGLRSIRFEAAASGEQPMQAAMAALRAVPPAELASTPVAAVHDLAAGSTNLPPADVVVLELFAIKARVVVRPSGTEPKMKVYAEAVILPDRIAGGALRSARAEARDTVAALLDATVAHVADPERQPRRTPVATLSDRQAVSGQPTRRDESRPGPASTHDNGKCKPDRDRAGLIDDLRLVVRCTDLTTLEGDDTPGRIRALCAAALRPDPADPTVGPVAAVCVYPALAGLAAELLEGTRVAVASVAGAFPSGLSPLAVKVAEVRAAVGAGATEIDTVLNRSAFLSGHLDVAADELRALREAAGEAHFKVILEVCELRSAEAIADATRLAIDCGADMVKTSTGKGSAGASLEAVAVMADTIAEHCDRGGRPVGLKIAGGVRTAADALAYLDLVRSTLGDGRLTPDRLRFGASSLLTNVVSRPSNPSINPPPGYAVSACQQTR